MWDEFSGPTYLHLQACNPTTCTVIPLLTCTSKCICLVCTTVVDTEAAGLPSNHHARLSDLPAYPASAMELSPLIAAETCQHKTGNGLCCPSQGPAQVKAQRQVEEACGNLLECVVCLLTIVLSNLIVLILQSECRCFNTRVGTSLETVAALFEYHGCPPIFPGSCPPIMRGFLSGSRGVPKRRHHGQPMLATTNFLTLR